MKQTFIGLLAIIAIGFAFIACDNGGTTTHTNVWGEWVVTTAPTETAEGEETRVCTLDSSHKETRPIAKLTPAECTCDTEEPHYLPCDCEVESPNICPCEVSPRGTIGNIKIWQTADVSNADAETATRRITNAYGILPSNYMAAFQTNYDNIYIVLDANSYDKTARTISINKDLLTSIINAYFHGVIDLTTQREFEITLLDKKVVVKDSRTDATDKSLEELGIIAKLEGAAIALEGIADIVSGERRPVYDRVLAKGLIIIIEKPETPYNNDLNSRTLDDGKTMYLDIDYITHSTVTNILVAGRINNLIVNFLDKGLEITKGNAPCLTLFLA